MRWHSVLAAPFLWAGVHAKEKVAILNFSNVEVIPSFITDNYEIIPNAFPLKSSSKTPIRNLIIVGNKKFGKKTDAQNKTSAEDVIKYAEDGGNILWVLQEEESSVASRELAAKMGRRLGKKLGIYKDHSVSSTLEVVSWEGLHGRAFSAQDYTVAIDSVFGHHVDSSSNPLTFPLIVGNPTGVVEGGDEEAFGSEVVIASALQSRLNSRITIASMKMDEGSAHLMEDLMKWTFQQKGNLSLQSLSHHLITPRLSEKEGYRINDEIDIEVCLGGDGDRRVQPDDIQVELVMLDAWIRADLHPSHDGCLHTGSLKLPARYGVYTLKLDYKRHGWDYINYKEKMVVRPLHHDEIVRYRFASLPYYISWFSVMFGSLLVLFLIFPSNSSKSSKCKDN